MLDFSLFFLCNKMQSTITFRCCDWPMNNSKHVAMYSLVKANHIVQRLKGSHHTTVVLKLCKFSVFKLEASHVKCLSADRSERYHKSNSNAVKVLYCVKSLHKVVFVM